MSAEGRACRQSAGARGGAGAAAAAAAAAREHTRGSEPRQPASPAPQRERPRRLARHLPPQCPQPSRGRAWTRLSKCGAPDPAPHGVHGLAPRGGRVARAASQKNPVRARSVPLAPSALRWAPPCSRVTPGILGRDAEWQGEGVHPLWAPPGYLQRSSKATAGQKVYTKAGTGRAQKRAGAVPNAFRA